MGYRLANIDKVLLINFVKHIDGNLVYNTINNITTVKLKFNKKSFELNCKFYNLDKIQSINMCDAFNYTTGLFGHKNYQFNRDTLNSIIKTYNDAIKVAS